MKDKGIATPVTLVVLMMVFVALLTATSYTLLGTLKGSATERAVYQAFLLAESALSAFPALVRCGGPPPQSYIFAVGGGPTVQVAYRYPNLQGDTLPMGGRVQVEARAEWQGAVARVGQTFQIGCGIMGAVPAALTSRPRIEVRGNAQVIGQDPSATGVLDLGVAVLTLVSAPALQNAPFSLSVSDASLIPVGSYLQIPTGGTPKTYRVEGKSENTLTLTPLFAPTLSDVILVGTGVRLVQYGVKAYDPTTYRLTLSDARGLMAGQKVRVAGQEATLVAVDPSTNTVTLSWSGTPPTSIPEGTPLVPQVVGAASSLNIDTSGGGQIQYGALPYSSLVPSDPNALFRQVFGMSKEDFLALYPPMRGSDFNGTLQNWELKVVQGPLNLSGSRQICGKGILVVIGDLTVNGSCPQGFQGLIYVAGDYDQQGNAVLTGSVVVEGVAELGNCQGEQCWTNIAGTGQGGGKIVYDPLVMHRLRVASQGLATVRPVGGTWRRL